MDMDDKLIKRLLSQLRCSVCGQRYLPEGTKVLWHGGDFWLLRVWCCECANSSVVVAMVGEEEVLEGRGDLTAEEVTRFEDAPPIGVDDVLDVHAALQDADADMTRLFYKGV